MPRMRPQQIALAVSAGITCLMVGLLLGILAGGGHVSHVLRILRSPAATARVRSDGPRSGPVPVAASTVTLTRRAAASTVTAPASTVTQTGPTVTHTVVSTLTVTATQTAPSTSGP